MGGLRDRHLRQLLVVSCCLIACSTLSIAQASRTSTLDFATGLGHCTFSGGTGNFTAFNASVTVTCAGANCDLDGTYSFSSKGDED